MPELGIKSKDALLLKQLNMKDSGAQASSSLSFEYMRSQCEPANAEVFPKKKPVALTGYHSASHIIFTYRKKPDQ